MQILKNHPMLLMLGLSGLTMGIAVFGAMGLIDPEVIPGTPPSKYAIKPETAKPIKVTSTVTNPRVKQPSQPVASDFIKIPQTPEADTQTPATSTTQEMFYLGIGLLILCLIGSSFIYISLYQLRSDRQLRGRTKYQKRRRKVKQVPVTSVIMTAPPVENLATFYNQLLPIPIEQTNSPQLPPVPDNLALEVDFRKRMSFNHLITQKPNLTNPVRKFRSV